MPTCAELVLAALSSVPGAVRKWTKISSNSGSPRPVTETRQFRPRLRHGPCAFPHVHEKNIFGAPKDSRNVPCKNVFRHHCRILFAFKALIRIAFQARGQALKAAKPPNPCVTIGDASDPTGDTLRICLMAMPQKQRRKSLIPVIPLAMPQIKQAIP